VLELQQKDFGVQLVRQVPMPYIECCIIANYSFVEIFKLRRFNLNIVFLILVIASISLVIDINFALE